MNCSNCMTGILKTPIDNHAGYLICENCHAIKLRYLPQDYQEEFHQTPYELNPKSGEIAPQIIGVFGGFGSAKSTATLNEVFVRALENPGGTGLLIAPTLQLLKRTTIKTFLNEIIPPPLIENYNKSEGEIKLINGFTFYTIPADDEEKLRSINAGIVHIEEASGINRSIYDQLLTRMRDKFVKNKLMCVCSNPSLGWIKEVLVDNETRKNPQHPDHENYNPYIKVFIWKTHLNKYLPADFIDMISKNKPSWWVERYINGSFNHSDGMVYPAVAQKSFTTSYEYGEIKKGWEKFISMDVGLRNPTAVMFGAINPEKREVVIYDEYYVAGKTVPEHATVLAPKIKEIPNGTLRFMVADPAFRNRVDMINGKSVQSLYQEYNLFFTEGNNNLEAGILRVNSYIERGKLKILTDKCPNLSREIIDYKFPEVSMDDNKNLDEKPIKKNDHACDALRYMLMRLPENPDDLTNLSYSPPKRYARIIGDANEYGWDDSGKYENDSEKGWMSYV